MAFTTLAMLTLVIAVMYMIPTLVAFARGVPGPGSILVLNVFLGWTFLGWVVALALALRGEPAHRVHVAGPLPPGPPSWQDPVSRGLADTPGRPADDPPSFSPPAHWN